MIGRYRVLVQGIVQGIGFRPYVYNLARQYNLRGYVSNNSKCVEIEIEGTPERLDSFLNEIENCRLPLARVTSIHKKPLCPAGYQDFTIRESSSFLNRTALIPPDICVCEDCLKEMNDPRDRRYRYPFINCTNCGPRYTIISDVPYDRPFTSMKNFAMCGDCLREYRNPADRRFHAQPNACPVCGPEVSLYDRERRAIETDDPILKTAELLKQGHILAVKGLGGFHLAADAQSDEAVRTLRTRKLREEKPLAIMSYDPARIRQYAYVDSDEEALLTSPERPIVLLKKKEPGILSAEISPGINNVGVMLPYTPLHHLLLASGPLALVMTSGNLSEEPIAIDNEDAFARLSDIADFFLIHDRDIYLRCDDSVIQKVGGSPRIIRRSRGYAPVPIFLKNEFPPILACGAELKNTICLCKNDRAFVSQHIGDLKNLESYKSFQLTISHLKKLFDIEPETVAYDLHPDYLSTRFALEQPDMMKVGVQHHHAHIVSCMTEHGLDGPVIGLSFDGTGYGTDGRIWGGEVLLARTDDFTRLAHLEYVPMPGGEAAIREPWRMAVSYLYHAFSDELWDLELPLFKTVEKTKINLILEMIQRRVNSPETSSLGRLFDGIAAILGLRYRAAYEGQAAIELEMIQQGKGESAYPFEWHRGEESYRISLTPIVRGVAEDLIKKKDKAGISQRFHHTVISLFADLCGELRKEIGLDQVVLSGGVFQNAVLLTGLEEALQEKGFSVFSHAQIPTNDGGISLGQAAVAAAVRQINGV